MPVFKILVCRKHRLKRPAVHIHDLPCTEINTTNRDSCSGPFLPPPTPTELYWKEKDANILKLYLPNYVQPDQVLAAKIIQVV